MDMDNIFQEYTELQKSVQCLVCNKFPSNLLISHCEHMFCGTCVDILLRRRIIKCPKCRTSLTRRMFVANSTVTNLISSLNLFKTAMDTDKLFEKNLKIGKVVTPPSTSCRLVVNESLIENYLENNLPSCDLKLDDQSYSVIEPQKNSGEKLDTSFDEFISVSQLPTPSVSKHASPLRVFTRKLKPDEKVKSWLTKHTTDFTNTTESQKQYMNEVEELGYTITQPSFSQINAYIVPRKDLSYDQTTDETDSQDKSSKELETDLRKNQKKSSGVNESTNESEKSNKIMPQCKVQLVDLKHVSTSNEESVTIAHSKKNKPEKSKMVKTRITNNNLLNIAKNKIVVNEIQNITPDVEKSNYFATAPSSDLFSTNLEDTNSPKCNQVQEKEALLRKQQLGKRKMPNTSLKICNTRKTFSLDANTEDLQSIDNVYQENTQDRLRSIFEKRVGSTQSSADEQTKTKKCKTKPSCTFIKAAKLGIKHYKLPKLIKQPVLFLLKGRLMSNYSKSRDIGVQCQTMDNIETNIITKKQIKTIDVGVQTSSEHIPSDSASYVSDSEVEKDLQKAIGNSSPEITLVENITDIDITVIPNYNNDYGKMNTSIDENILHEPVHIRSKFEFKTDENTSSRRSKHNITRSTNNKIPNERNSKRKRSADKPILSERPAKTFKRIRNTSMSSDSDSDFQSCLLPIKHIAESEIPDDNLSMDEDLTVKFVSMHESENQNSNILLKHKVKRLTPSSGSSLKENDTAKAPVTSDSEPLNYDEILSTVFANIDAELDPLSNKLSQKNQYNKEDTFVPNACLNNITNTAVTVNTRSPVKPIKDPLKSYNNQVTKITENKINIPSSTPICSSKKFKGFGTASKILDISIESINKTSDIDRIVGALESDYMRKELDTQNRLEISYQEQHVSKINQNISTVHVHTTDSENEVQKTPDLTYRPNYSKGKKKTSGRSKRSLDFMENNKILPIEKPGPSKNVLDETLSTIIDCPKQGNISDIKKLYQNDISDMELCSPMDAFVNTDFETEKTLVPQPVKINQLEKADTSNKSQDLMANTEKTLGKYHNTRDSDMDFVPNSLEVKQFCIACSCLTKEDTLSVTRFTEQFNLRFVTQYEDDVSHLIVRVNKDNCCERSLKFINAVAAGAWVVNKNWILDSLSAQKLLPEDKYEALDVSSEPGPKRNRLAIHRTLFHFLSVVVIGPFNSTTTEQVKILLKKSGARIMSPGIAPGMIVVDENTQEEDQIEVIYNKFKVPVVDIMWILDCICKGRITNITDYVLMPDVCEVDQRKYPVDLFQGTEQCT